MAVFCFFISQFFVRAVLSVSTVQHSPFPRYAYLLSETGGEWFVIGASSGYVLLSKRRGALILALSKADADFLSFYFTSFQFVSVSCWAPGWMGGWGMTGDVPPSHGGVWVRDAKGGSHYPLRRNRLIVDSKLPLSLFTMNTRLTIDNVFCQ